jgi:hypothetical protein
MACGVGRTMSLGVKMTKDSKGFSATFEVSILDIGFVLY